MRGDFTLHYCARAHDKAAFLTELNEAGFRDRVHLHFDDGPRPQRFDRARDIPQPADDVHLYVCGPDGFVAWIIAEARRFGYREPHSHREYFKTALDRSGEAFDVVLSRSNRRVTVGAESTIVAALADAGVKITTLLRGGDLRHLPAPSSQAYLTIATSISPTKRRPRTTRCCCVARGRRRRNSCSICERHGEAAMPATVDQHAFREAMSRLGAAVSIITTDGPAGRNGLTASAVGGVTCLPKPPHG